MNWVVTMHLLATWLRLGKRPEGNATKPRPAKLTIASEGQKERFLRRSKNLKGMCNGLETVFVLQDLTPNRRERKNMLVEEMKGRYAKRETDLILNGKIVKRVNPNNTSVKLPKSNFHIIVLRESTTAFNYVHNRFFC